MTGPIARVVCPTCGGLFARRRDGRTPYRHRCTMGRRMDDHRVVDAMERYGGAFVQALARAALRADPVNLAKLKRAFPEYWDEYTRLAARAAETERP